MFTIVVTQFIHYNLWLNNFSFEGNLGFAIDTKGTVFGTHEWVGLVLEEAIREERCCEMVGNQECMWLKYKNEIRCGWLKFIGSWFEGIGIWNVPNCIGKCNGYVFYRKDAVQGGPGRAFWLEQRENENLDWETENWYQLLKLGKKGLGLARSSMKPKW